MAAVTALGIVAAIAFADTIMGDANTITAGVQGSIEKAPGTSGSGVFALVVNDNAASGGTDPQNGCNAQTSSPVVMNVSSNQAWLTVTQSTISVTNCDSGTTADGLQNAATVNYAVANSAPASATATIIVSYSSGGKSGGTYTSGSFNVTTPAATDTTKPTITATAKNADNSTYVADTWTNQSVTVSFACADNIGGSGLATNTVGGGGTLSSDTSTGSFTNTGTCVDNAGNVADSVTFSPIKIDKTKPLISASATSNGNPYTAGDWTKHDVIVGFTCSDGSGSGIATDTVAGGTVSLETSNGSVANTGTCVDNAGNTANSAAFSPIKIDKTAPAITDEGPTAAPNGDNGWYTVDVVNEFKAEDPLSGLSAACDAAFDQTGDIRQVTISAEGSAVKGASGTCADGAGNEAASIDSAEFMVDKTAPSTSVTGPSNGGSYTLGSVPAAGCSSTDGTPLETSGVATEASPTTTGGPVGSVTTTCAGAKDNAGNTNTTGASVTYTVTFSWTGFFSPVDNGGVYNKAKAGSAIPVKFSLNGNQGLDITDSGFPKSQVISCSAAADVDGVEQTVNAGQSSLSYDALANQYVYVWKTDKSWATAPNGPCRQLVVKLDDGTSHRANFQFTK